MFKARRSKKSGARAIILGILFSCVSYLAVSFIAAIIIKSTQNPGAHVGMTSLIALLISGGVSGAVNSIYKGEGGVACATLSSLIFSLILFACGMTVNGGKVPFVTVISIACFTVMATVFAFLARGRAHTHRR